MFTSTLSRWVNGVVIASLLSLPTFATASEDLESRISALEAQVSELSGKVDMLATAMEKTAPAKSSPSRDLKSTWMQYDSRGAQEPTRFWPDFWEKEAHEGH